MLWKDSANGCRKSLFTAFPKSLNELIAEHRALQVTRSLRFFRDHVSSEQKHHAKARECDENEEEHSCRPVGT